MLKGLLNSSYQVVMLAVFLKEQWKKIISQRPGTESESEVTCGD